MVGAEYAAPRVATHLMKIESKVRRVA